MCTFFYLGFWELGRPLPMFLYIFHEGVPKEAFLCRWRSTRSLRCSQETNLGCDGHEKVILLVCLGAVDYLLLVYLFLGSGVQIKFTL